MTLFPYLLLRTPSQSRLSAVPALPKGEPRGGCAAQLDSHLPSNRVTPNGVGQLPGSQTRHCLRGHPALSVTAFSRASSPIGRAKGRLRRPARLPPTTEPGDPQRCGSAARVTDSYCQRVHTRPLSHGFQPCQLFHRESQGAGVARPAHRKCCPKILFILVKTAHVRYNIPI